MNKKLGMALVLTALLAIGTVFVFATEAETQPEEQNCRAGIRHPFFNKMKERLDLPEDATREEIGEAMKEKMAERIATIIGELGLPEDATREQIREALMEEREANRAEHIQRVKEKLGLPEDATEEEIRAAIAEWREENKDLLRAGCHRPPRHFRGLQAYLNKIR